MSFNRGPVCQFCDYPHVVRPNWLILVRCKDGMVLILVRRWDGMVLILVGCWDGMVLILVRCQHGMVLILVRRWDGMVLITRVMQRWYGFGHSWGVWSDSATSWDVRGCVILIPKRLYGLISSWEVGMILVPREKSSPGGLPRET